MKEFDNKRLAGPNNTLDNASNKEGSDNKCEFALFFDAIAKKRGLNRSNVAFKLDIDPERFKKNNK